jgi:hypothetical protein
MKYLWLMFGSMAAALVIGPALGYLLRYRARQFDDAMEEWQRAMEDWQQFRQPQRLRNGSEQ